MTRKSQRLARLENELSALGYTLVRQYAILSGSGYVEETFSTLDEVDKWAGHEETRQLGFAGGDDE